MHLDGTFETIIKVDQTKSAILPFHPLFWFCCRIHLHAAATKLAHKSISKLLWLQNDMHRVIFFLEEINSLWWVSYLHVCETVHQLLNKCKSEIVKFGSWTLQAPPPWFWLGNTMTKSDHATLRLHHQGYSLTTDEMKFQMRYFQLAKTIWKK